MGEQPSIKSEPEWLAHTHEFPNIVPSELLPSDNLLDEDGDIFDDERIAVKEEHEVLVDYSVTGDIKIEECSIPEIVPRMKTEVPSLVSGGDLNVEFFEEPPSDNLLEVKAEQPDDEFQDTMDEVEGITIKEELQEQGAYLKQEIWESDHITIDENVTTCIVPNITGESPSTSKHEDSREVVKKETQYENGESSAIYSQENLATGQFYRSTLIPQMLVYSLQGIYPCSSCEQVFANESKLKEHLVAHRVHKIYAGDPCKKLLPQECKLKEHKFVHSSLKSLKPYACEICGNAYKMKGHLTIHMLFHSGRRAHTCNICNKAFTQLCGLKEHLLVYSGNKPHTCEVCARSFGLKSNLKRHKIVHSGHREYVCDKCEKAFTNKKSLEHHVHITCRLANYQKGISENM